MKKFFATIVDYGETCDGKARLAGPFDSKDEAKAWANDDMKTWLENNAMTGKNFDVDYCRMSISSKNYNESLGCEWNVHDVDV